MPNMSGSAAEMPVSYAFPEAIELQRRTDTPPPGAWHEPMESRYEFRCWPNNCQTDDMTKFFASWDRVDDSRRTDTYIFRKGCCDLLMKLRDQTHFQVKRKLGQRGQIDLWGLQFSSAMPLQDDVRRWLSNACEFSPFNKGKWSQSAHAFLCQVSIEPEWDFLPVSKSRSRFRKGKLTGEVTLVSTRGFSMHSVAVESEDALVLEECISAEPFAGLANRDYGAALREYLRR